MRKIWKYELPLHGELELDLPEDARLLHVGVQLNSSNEPQPMMWVAVAQDSKQQARKFKYKVLQTGEAYDEDMIGQYLGTFQLEKMVDDQATYYVGHLFRKGA